MLTFKALSALKAGGDGPYTNVGYFFRQSLSLDIIAIMAYVKKEDEGLKTAIAMSLATDVSIGSHGSPMNTGSTVIPTASTAKVTPMESNPASGFAGLDRRAMEEERLARRTRKRERSISPPPFRDSRKAPKLEAETVSLPSGARLTSFSTLVSKDQQSRKSEVANAANQQLKSPPAKSTVKQEPDDEQRTDLSSSPQASLQYPTGVVKKTWAFGFNRTGNDVKLEEVLEPRTLRTAVLSAFQWSPDWVLSKLKVPPDGNTKCIFVMQAEGDALRQQMMRETEDKRAFLRLCLPPMDGQIHCMHSKLMLLFHAEKLRVAIPTANLLNFDWGETGVMENSVFMIDLPRLPDGGKSEASELTPFAKEMLYYLEKQGLDEDVRSGVLKFDFSATQHMMFVHTAGGIYYGEEAERTGLLGLARAVRKLNLQTDHNLEMDFAASSIGSLNDEYLRSFHAAARGEDLISRAKAASSKAKADFFKSSAKKAPSEGANIQDRLRIYFPTKDTVTSSIAGAAGTICLSRKWYESATFPKSCFRDYRSTRTGLLSHNKILYARAKQTQTDGSIKHVAWAYVGSANMSESAWGKLVFDNKQKSWKINCRNWECGVLLPVSTEKIAEHSKASAKPIKKEKIGDEDSETESEDEAPVTNGASPKSELIGMEVFEGLVQPPFEMPGRKYDVRQPWYFQENR